MADKELGALSPIEALLAAALFHTVQNGNSRKVTAQQISDFVNGNYPAFIQTLLSAQSAEDVYAAIGAAPDADKLGGQSPAFFASAEAVADALTDKVPTSRTVAGKPLTGNITLDKADVGLGNVSNTSDANKPVSIAQAEAINAKVSGPNGGIAANDLAVFADTTGTILKKAPNNVVGNALLSQLAAPAIKGRLTAGTGDVEDLTPAQARRVIGGWEFIGSYDLAGLAALDVTGLGAYRTLKISMASVHNADVAASVRFSSDNGATFGADSDEFYELQYYAYHSGSGSPTFESAGGTASSGALTQHGGNTGWPALAENTIFEFNQVANSAMLNFARLSSGALRYTRSLSSAHKRAVALNALRIFVPSSTIQRGVLQLEGVRS